MEETQPSIFDNDVDVFAISRRRTLLPWWIKVFNCLFMISGGGVLIVFILGLVGLDATMALYGLETRDVLSPVGLVLTGVYLLKGIVAYGLWSEKKWAVNVGMADACIGIIICIYTTFANPSSSNGIIFNFRLELVFLYFYLRKLIKIRYEWENYSGE